MTRFDVVDRFGKVTLRHAGRMRHLGVGVAHATTRVIILIDGREVVVTDYLGGTVLSRHLVDDAANYWRNQDRPAGRWPR